MSQLFKLRYSKQLNYFISLHIVFASLILVAAPSLALAKKSCEIIHRHGHAYLIGIKGKLGNDCCGGVNEDLVAALNARAEFGINPNYHGAPVPKGKIVPSRWACNYIDQDGLCTGYTWQPGYPTPTRENIDFGYY